MEEKVLIKGVLGGKFISVSLYILAAFIVFIFTIVSIANYDEELLPIGIAIAVVLVVVAKITNFIMKKRELIVTNKRVIARSAFGYRTDLPIEKVTDVSMRIFGGIGCGSPSKKIMFHFCKNKTEIFDTIISESLQRDSKYQ